MIRKNTLAGLALLLAGSLACDPSKAELDKTKVDLQTVTTERDGLKSQLDQANAKVATLTQQLTDLQAKAAAAAAPAPAEEKAEAKPEPKGKKGAKAAKPAPMPSKEVQKAAEEKPVAAPKGAGRF